MQEQKLTFDSDSIKALNIMEKTNKCLYLTWKAGAWKSTIVNYFVSKTKKKFVLLWTTGISAINIWWLTIHKFFWIIPWKDKMYMTSDNMRIARNTDIFIIDEVSMMRADLFDLINYRMQTLMKNDLFMWWKQFVFVWDLFQLPPVPEKEWELREYYQKNYKWLFFFDWNSYNKENFEIVELTKVYRQDNPQFISMLNRVRIWDRSKDILEYFNSKLTDHDLINPKAILIWTTNYIVDKKNQLELSKLPWDESVSYAYISWDYPVETYPTDYLLKIKVWCRIMFTVNEKSWFYVNWTLWTILEINNNDKWFINSVKIQTDDWDILDISKNTWVNSPWDDEFWQPIIDWTFTQLPFKLAFAITIHKVQWKSFDNVVIDLWSGAFAEWQAYVALSRCRSFEWLQLLKPLKISDIRVSREVIKYLI